MSATAILAIVVATADVQDPATASMLAAAAESLGQDVSVRVLGASRPADIEPVTIEHDLGASAVVSLIWMDAARLNARIRLHLAAGNRSTTRDVAFSPADTRVERGRTLGLAAASMWPESAPVARADSSVPSQASVPRAPPAEIEAKPRPPVPAGSGGGPTSSGIPRASVGVAVIGASGVAGPAGEVGGGLEGVIALGSNWSLRMALSLRWGRVSALKGSNLVGALAGGVEWWPAALSVGRAARLGARADALALGQRVSGTVIAGRPEVQTVLLPGFALMAQLTVRIARSAQLLVAAGGEAALGVADIRSGTPPVPVATIPTVRFAAEVGLRVVF